MHLIGHFEDCTACTLTRVRSEHLRTKALLPFDALRRKAAQLHQLPRFLAWMKDQAVTVREKLTGYEYGDPEQDTLKAELRTLQHLRDELVRRELAPATYLLEDPERECSITNTPEALAPWQDIGHGKEVAL